MKLIVGLGNPGSEYERHRHNVGFMAVDAIADKLSFPQWRKKFQGDFTKSEIDGIPVILLKPMTYMNLSGQSVGELARFHKIKVKDIYVLHDELDLAPGKVRFKTGGGVAGHNGLKSMREHVGADFHRLRIGIGHPGQKHLVSPWVLGNFSKADHSDWLDEFLYSIPKAAPLLFEGNGAKFLTKLSLLRGEKPNIDAPKSKTPKSVVSSEETQQSTKKNITDQKASSPFAALKDALFKSTKDS